MLRSRICGLIVFALLITGCSQTPSGNTAKPAGSEESGAASAPTETKGTIGYSALTLTNPFFKTIADAMEAEAAKHGFQLLVVSGERDVKKQADQVDDFIVKGVSAIVLNPCDKSSIGPAIKKANDAGIPVFTNDLAYVGSEGKVICHVATDNLQGGLLAGDAMVKLLGESGGKVAIIDFPQAESCQLRVQGFKEKLDAHNAQPGADQILIVSRTDGGGMRDEGYKAAKDALESNPDLAAFFAINDPSALGAHAALEAAGKTDQVKIIGFDGEKAGKEAIRDGKIVCDPVQYPDLIGAKTIEMMMKYLAGDDIEQEMTDGQILIPSKLYYKSDADADPALKEQGRMGQAAATAEKPLLEMRDIGKSFPGVRALDSVDLTLHRGEVLALLGENGAGKSTLIKMLGGAQAPDSGTIQIDGRPINLTSPAAANAAGIGVIFQEFNLVPGLTPWENIFLGRERCIGFAKKSLERTRAQNLFTQIGVEVPIDVRCGDLSVAQQQIIEIAKALSQDVRLIVMDEPSAALTPREVDRLFAIIRDLRSKGIGVIYISHRLDEVFEVADRITVLRDGQHVGDARVDEITRQQMIEMMVGREIEDEFPKEQHEIGPTRLQVQKLSRGDAVRDISFEVRRGEILGFTGLVGAGRTEMARLIFGADHAESGTIHLDGESLRISNPRDAIQAGICLLTEDRKSQGLVLGLSVRENFGLPNMAELSSAGFIDRRRERDLFDKYIGKLQIKTPNQEQLAKNLSGGNQQKIVLAKWLQRNAEVVIFDEPTRGIDVGAKYEIYLLMNNLAKQGKAIVMITSELPEALGMSDRIIVMHEGRITGEIDDVKVATQEQIMELAVG